MSQFELDKQLPEKVAKSIGNLETLFQEIFRQITFFQNELNLQHGLAASALKRNLNQHIELMGKSAPILLNFTEVMKSFLEMILSTDEGYGSFVKPKGRAEWKYSLSVERIEEEIEIDSSSLRAAADSFKANLATVEEVFHEFNRLLDDLLSDSHIPWDDFESIWGEAKHRIRTITEETNEHIEKLIKQTSVFVYELNRVDHMASLYKVI